MWLLSRKLIRQWQIMPKPVDVLTAGAKITGAPIVPGRTTSITVRDKQRNPELIIRNKLPRVNQKANPKVSPRGSHRIGKRQELPRVKERVVKVIRREEVRKQERVERKASIIHK